MVANMKPHGKSWYFFSKFIGSLSGKPKGLPWDFICCLLIKLLVTDVYLKYNIGIKPKFLFGHNRVVT